MHLNSPSNPYKGGKYMYADIYRYILCAEMSGGNDAVCLDVCVCLFVEG